MLGRAETRLLAVRSQQNKSAECRCVGTAVTRGGSGCVQLRALRLVCSKCAQTGAIGMQYSMPDMAK